jgi:radical SAM-linked protein
MPTGAQEDPHQSEGNSMSELTRYRLWYARGTELRYVSHLDMMLVWERTFRRARLPLAFSQGFNPRPRFHLASALPLGFTSLCEVADVWLVETLPPDEVQERLQRAAPPGLTLQQVEIVPLHLPALQTLVLAAEYRIEFREDAPVDLADRIAGLLEQREIIRVRREKTYDLRPLIESLTLTTSSEGDKPILLMRLSAKESATARPEEVLLALGIDPTTTRMERTRLIFQDPIPAP